MSPDAGKKIRQKACKKPTAPANKHHIGFVPCMKKLHADMCSLLKHGEYSDLTILCKGEEFQVHKAILLPRCDFFRACFNGGFKEGEDGVVVLDDDDPAALRMALTEIYTRSPSTVSSYFWSTNNANLITLVETWKLADKYGLPNLTQQCLAYLQSQAGLAILKLRSDTAWKLDLLLGLSDTRTMRTTAQGGNYNTELRDEIKKLFFLSKNLSDLNKEEEEVLQADPELTIELLMLAVQSAPNENIADRIDEIMEKSPIQDQEMQDPQDPDEILPATS